MDDITNKRFGDLAEKIEGLAATVSETVQVEVAGAEQRLSATVRVGFSDLKTELGGEIAKNHREQMGRFQTVIEQTESLGRKLGKLEERADSERDRRIALLETDLATMRANFARLEEMFLKLLGGGAKQ